MERLIGAGGERWTTIYQHSDAVKKISTTAIQPVWNQVKSFLTTTWQAISDLATTVWTAIYTVIFGQVQKTFTTAVQPIWTEIRSFLVGIWNGIHDDATSIWGGIFSTLTMLLQQFQTTFGSIWNGLSGVVSGALNAVSGTVSRGLGGIEGVLNTFINAADAALGGLGFHVNPLPISGGGGSISGTVGAPALAAGGVFNKATAIVGEGGHSEYVIPTDPAYRQRALALWQSAGAALMASGGILGQLIAGPESALLSGMSGIGGVMGTLGSGIAKQLIGDLGTWAGNLATSAATSAVAGATGVAAATAGAVSGNVASWLTSALALTGEPLSWLPALEIIAAHESGGNPNAVQGGISAAAAGRGLMQTISSTFAAYALPGLNDIYNPIDNAAAAIKYIVANYGNPSNTPGVRSIDAGGGYQGYSAGGVITADTGSVVLRPGLNAVMNGTGAPEPLSSGGGGQSGTQLATHQDAVNILAVLQAIARGSGGATPLGMIQQYG